MTPPFTTEFIMASGSLLHSKTEHYHTTAESRERSDYTVLPVREERTLEAWLLLLPVSPAASLVDGK
jgi:hypothetical protein